MKKLAWVVFLAIALTATSASAQPPLAGSGEKSRPADGILGLTAITDVKIDGQKLSAVAIEYAGVVDFEQSGLNTFPYIVQDIKDDTTARTLVPASATIKCIYTNTEAAMRPDHTSIPGPYVIIEIIDTDPVGSLPATYYYYAANGEKKSKTYWLRSDVATRVIQNTEVKNPKGETISAPSSLAMPMTNPTIHLKIGRFKDLTLTSRNNGWTIPVKYCLPEGYDASKRYPLVISLPGAGTMYWEENGVNNFGRNITGDKAAVSWLDAPEDVIIAAPHVRFSFDPAYDGPKDIVQTIEYFIDNFSADPDRVYITGNSAGTIYGARTVVLRPDLIAGMALCNGNVGAGNPDGGPDDHNADFEYLETYLAEVADQEIGFWFHHGVHDPTANIEEARQPYAALRAIYASKGMSGDEIEKVLRITEYQDEQFYPLGQWNYHSATKLAYELHGREVMAWLLSQKKRH